MTSFEKFLLAQGQSSPSAASSSRQPEQHSLLTDDARQAANHGLRIFPVSQLAKLMARADLLIDEATSDVNRLGVLVAEHGPCREWRAVADPWLCVLRIDGTAGGNSSVATLSLGSQEDCHTLMARRGDIAWAFFKSPKGFVPRPEARDLAPGLSIVSAGLSCPIPMLGGRSRGNHLCAAIEILPVPFWLRELAFEPLDSPPGKAAPVHVPSLHPGQCRPPARFAEQRRNTRKGYPVCGRAEWRGGYSISRRR
jgi:hypothetical protein